jgi:hypothetical protein
MHGDENHSLAAPHRRAWNTGKFLGAKPTRSAKARLVHSHELQLQRRIRDLAMFNIAIARKLRGGEVVALIVEDVAPNGHAAEGATVTGQLVRFEQARQAHRSVSDRCV